MHSGATATTAVAVFITSVALGASGRGVLRLLVLWLSWVATLRVGDLMLRELRLAAVHARFVHADFELAVSRNGHDAASVVVLEEGVEVVAVIVLGGVRSFDQRVDHDDQQDQDPRGEYASARDAGLHLKYEEHEDGHSCQRGEEKHTESCRKSYLYTQNH